MKVLADAKISLKIITSLLILGAVTLIVTWNGSRALLTADSEYNDLTGVVMPNATSVARANKRQVEMAYAAYRAMVYAGGSSEVREAANDEATAFGRALEFLEGARDAEPAEARRYNDMIARTKQLHALTAAAVKAGLRDDDGTARELLAQADPIMAGLNDDTVTFLRARSAATNKQSDALTAKAKSTSSTMYVLSLLGVLGGIALSLFVSKKGITGPLASLQTQMGEISAGDFRREVAGLERGDEVGAMAKAVAVFRSNGIAKEAADRAKAQSDADQTHVVDTVSTHLSALSGGDLTASITADFPGEYATLKANFNEALGNLRELIGSVSESASAITTGSGEIAQASEDLARRTESNAASLEETAASVTQMDGRLKASAGAASRTVERADQAIETVGGGRAVADEAVQAMGRVSESAKGIDSVIEGLDKIAFQTRVLAMNAAVEAGRAGDAGRGFAVVADLVSALAMRAEEEAKRARDQLTVTQTDIVTAVEAVQKVDGALAAISGDVGQVHELLATMAADNQAQSAAITQISAAIGTMDQATQQNAAMVEETSAAARNLAAEVNGLAEQAGRFVVGDGARPQSTRRTAPAGFGGKTRDLPAKAIPALVRSTTEDDWTSF